MRVWIRSLPEDHPSCINLAADSIGFRRLGAEIVSFTDVREILHCASRSDVVIDGIKQLKQYFASLGIEMPHVDYPDVLLPFAHRRIWKDTLGNMRRKFFGQVFVKPTEEKLFSGMVVRSVTDWAPVVSVSLNQEVYCSDVIDIRNEYRAFIRYDQVLDVRPYKGDYHYLYDPEELDKMICAFTSWEQRPAACALDIAVTGDRKTVFLELNDGYAVGAYGLDPIEYARFLTTRWTQLMGIPDPYKIV